jgi:hypothetical protein
LINPLIAAHSTSQFAATPAARFHLLNDEDARVPDLSLKLETGIS